MNKTKPKKVKKKLVKKILENNNLSDKEVAAKLNISEKETRKIRNIARSVGAINNSQD